MSKGSKTDKAANVRIKATATWRNDVEEGLVRQGQVLLVTPSRAAQLEAAGLARVEESPKDGGSDVRTASPGDATSPTPAKKKEAAGAGKKAPRTSATATQHKGRG